MLETPSKSMLSGVKVPHVVIDRCAVGQRLYEEWTEAMESHDLMLIYFSMQNYFFHKNGMGTKIPCCLQCSEIIGVKE